MQKACTLCLLLLFAALTSRIVAAQSNTSKTDYVFSFAFGSWGSGNGQLYAPAGLAIAPSGNIVVADEANNRIQVFNKWGKFLFTFGSEGPPMDNKPPGLFYHPHGVAVTPSGNIIVADTYGGRIQVFDRTGKFLFTFGNWGSGNGQYNYAPFGVAIAPSGNIVTTDTNNGRIQVYDKHGKFLFLFGSPGYDLGQLDQPLAVATTRSGNIVVADEGNNRIQVFDKTGKFLFTFGSAGSGPGQFNRTYGVAITPSGNIVVTDALNNRVQVFDKEGKFLSTFGSSGEGKGQFFLPWGIAVDARGNLVVVDNSHVQVFVPVAK